MANTGFSDGLFGNLGQQTSRKFHRATPTLSGLGVSSNRAQVRPTTERAFGGVLLSFVRSVIG
jgi:hypothetical protein